MENLFFDGVHPTAEGYTIVAQLVYQALFDPSTLLPGTDLETPTNDAELDLPIID
jgi:phospholipase/lecithinase/hemolysin